MPPPVRSVRQFRRHGAARHLSLAGPDGPVLVPLEGSNQLCELNLADGRITSTTTGVGRQPHDAAQTAGGTIVVTNERGGGVLFVRAGMVVAVTSRRPRAARWRRGGG